MIAVNSLMASSSLPLASTSDAAVSSGVSAWRGGGGGAAACCAGGVTVATLTSGLTKTRVAVDRILPLSSYCVSLIVIVLPSGDSTRVPSAAIPLPFRKRKLVLLSLFLVH